MASETRSVITVDEANDPPRWVRVSGLRYFNEKLLVTKCVVIAWLAGMMFTITQPLSLTQTGSLTVYMSYFAIYAIVIWLIGWVIRNKLKKADIDALAGSPSHLSIHREAILASAYTTKNKSRSSGECGINPAAFRRVYHSVGRTPPSVVVIGRLTPDGSQSPAGAFQQIIGDEIHPSFFSKRGLKANLVFIALVLLYFAFAGIGSTPSTVFAGQSWIAWTITLAVGALLHDLTMKFVSPQGSAIVGAGSVEFKRRWVHQSLNAERALCVVLEARRSSTLFWIQPGSVRARFVLHFHNRDDPRIQTIVNLWTADPISDR